MDGSLANGGGHAAGDALARLAADNQRLRARVERLNLRLAEVERLADSDPLVPLPNRRAFVREVARVLRAVRRYGSSAAIVFVDVNGLKAVNDAHGHLAGDTVLIHIAGLLRAQVRAADFVARIGGDEFGVILEHLDPDAAAAKAQALTLAVAAAPATIAGVAVPIGIASGVATVRADDEIPALLARADADMYARKLA